MKEYIPSADEFAGADELDEEFEQPIKVEPDLRAYARKRRTTESAKPTSRQKSRQAILPLGCVRTRDGRLHKVRGDPVKANPRAPCRRRRGKGYEQFRKDIMGRVKRARRQVWIEINLHDWARHYGRCLRTLRIWWQDVQQDPIFALNMSVRLHQVRLDRNACPVIIAAHWSNLKHDREPLFYERDRKTSRHLREAWRADDLEERAGESAVSLGTQYTSFHYTQQLSKNNGARAEIESSRPGASTAAGQTDANPRAGPEKKVNSSDHLEQSPAENAGGPRKHWVEGQPMTVEGRKRLGKKAVWLALKCSDEHFNWNCQVDFRFDHARVFCWTGLREGLPALLILRAWREAIHAAHADAIDRMARVPCALALFYARRWLGQHTHGSTRERIEKFYEGRKETHNIQKKYYGEPVKKSKPKNSEDEIAMENWARQRRGSKGEKPKLSEIVEEVIEGKHVQN